MSAKSVSNQLGTTARNRKIDFIYEFLPDEFTIPPEEYERVISKIIKTMEKHDNIVGLSFVKANGLQPLPIARSNEFFTNILTIGSVLKSMDPKEYFKELGDLEYKGLGHLAFETFDIYFARITDNLAIAFQFTDIKLKIFQASDSLIKFIRQSLGQYFTEELSDKITKPINKIVTKKESVEKNEPADKVKTQDTQTSSKRYTNINDIRDVIKSKTKSI
ncbi:MAG: hypothetical protein IH840_17105 [Candidatus Heimdallarchaeota archaeon]|nr:hypothetical protein [Candidatus Heimdallarchaeota archaeon]